jgi:hypothetical protein
MFPATAYRVEENSAGCVNEEIRQQTEANVRRVARAGRPAIDRRLAELDREWDIERYLETMAPTFTLAGTILGLTVNKRWFVVPLVVQGFFLLHALQGWCPPIPVLRRLGVRTMREINEERMALLAIRGDFHNVSPADPLGTGEPIRAAAPLAADL